MNRSFTRALAASSLFLLLSVILIPYAGIQNDEALFTTPLYLNITKDLRVRILHHDVFLMLMSYIGALKTMIFAPIFWLLGTNRWTMRLPVALFGAATIFIFYWFTERACGRRAAVLGALLLATDPVFLLTNTFDWGPVALEHILLVTGGWSLLCFAQSSPGGFAPGSAGAAAGSPPDSERKYLWVGFLCLGLGLWNKAIFAWALLGLTVATVVVFRPEVRRLATRRNLKTAVAAFVLGALPLIVYNLRHHNATLRENAHVEADGPLSKWVQLKGGLNGSTLFGYMVSEEWRDQPKAPAGRLGRASVWVRERIGEHHATGFYYVFGALLIAVPLWWRSRAARFSLVFMAVTWLAMTLTRGAGGSAHHVILLWPFPLLFAAIAVSRLADLRLPKLTARVERPAFAAGWLIFAVGIAMVGMNLVVVNQYLVQFERNGPAEVFTDAIYPLSDQLASFAGRPIYVIDWGLINGLGFLQQGRLRLDYGSGPLMNDSPDERQRQLLGRMIADPQAVFVGHVAGEEMFPMVNERLDRAAQGLDYRKEILRTVADLNGRPRFEVFRFVRGR